MENKIGNVPDFTPDEGVQEEPIEEVKQEADDGEPASEEKETPAELPAESSEEEQKPSPSGTDDIGNLTRQVTGLQEEREKLLKEIQTLRGSRRELKQQEIASVDKKIESVSDELKDLHPDDVSLIEKVARSKGLMTKAEAQQMFYDVVKNEEVSKFLDKFPEYKPENDLHDLNWNAIQRQIQELYRMPSDPRKVGDLLLRAHRDIAKAPSDRGTVEVKRQQVKVASSGSSGAQRSSPKPVNPRLSSLLRTHMQGWSEEEIRQLEQKLPE